MKISRALVAGGLFAILLSGCASDDPAPIADPPSAIPTAIPTATKPSNAEPDPTVLTAEGMGYLVLGTPVPTVDAADALVKFDPTYCGGTAGEPYAGAWVAPGDGFLVDDTDDGTMEGDLSAIAVYTAGVTTAAGISVGSTKEEFLSAYPEAASASDSFDIYSIAGTAGTLYVEFQSGAVVAMVAQSTNRGGLNGALYATDAYHPCL